MKVFLTKETAHDKFIINNNYLFIWNDYWIDFYSLDQQIFDCEYNPFKNRINLTIC